MQWRLQTYIGTLLTDATSEERAIRQASDKMVKDCFDHAKY